MIHTPGSLRMIHTHRPVNTLLVELTRAHLEGAQTGAPAYASVNLMLWLVKAGGEGAQRLHTDQMAWYECYCNIIIISYRLWHHCIGPGYTCMLTIEVGSGDPAVRAVRVGIRLQVPVAKVICRQKIRLVYYKLAIIIRVLASWKDCAVVQHLRG